MNEGNDRYSAIGNPKMGLTGATLGFFVGFAAVSLFAPTAKSIQEVMDLGPVMVGFLVATPALSGSLLRIPFSAWVDTTGGRKPFLILLSLSIIGMLGLSIVLYTLYPDDLTTDHLPVLLVLGALAGCGIATFSVGISQVSYWYPQSQQGRALGTFGGVGNIAPGMFAFLLPISLASIGLVGSYMAWLIFLSVGTLIYFFIGGNAWYFQLRKKGLDPEEAKKVAKEKYGQELFPKGKLTESLKISARIWKTWAFVALYFTTFGGFIALTAWLPTYWQVFYGYELVIAGALTATFSILASVIRVGGGFVSDKLGGEKTTIIAISILLIGAIVMTLSSIAGVSIAATIVMAAGMGIANASVFKLVPQEIPQAVGGAAGWVGGLGAFGGFAIPPVMAVFVSVYGDSGYSTGFVVFIALSVMSLGLALFIRSKSEVGKTSETKGADTGTTSPAPSGPLKTGNHGKPRKP